MCGKVHKLNSISSSIILLNRVSLHKPNCSNLALGEGLHRFFIYFREALHYLRLESIPRLNIVKRSQIRHRKRKGKKKIKPSEHQEFNFRSIKKKGRKKCHCSQENGKLKQSKFHDHFYFEAGSLQREKTATFTFE